jgi:hypothetical protein
MRWSSRRGDTQLTGSSPGPEAYTTCEDVNTGQLISPGGNRFGFLSGSNFGLTTLQASLDVADRPLAPPRFDAGISTDAGSFTTGDLGVSPDRTFTGRLP